jgi:uncharacterized protein (DUF983 family)
VPEALRDLAALLERQDINVWVLRPAKLYHEHGVLKAACPECGTIHEFAKFDNLTVLVCDECGEGVDIEDESAAEG